MAKKDIGKILTTGTPKQRILLIAEDIARGKFNQDRLLTDQEHNQLSDSFKKTNEIKLWNQFRKADEAVSNAIMNLQGLKYEVLMHYSNLRGYILVWETIQEAETLSNLILHEIKDQEERIKIGSQAGRLGNFLFTDIHTDKEGYLDIQVDFETETYTDEDGNYIGIKEKPKKTNKYSLWYVMNNVKKEAEGALIKYLSWESAILDYMDEKGFNIKTYKEKINEMTTQVISPIIGWAKYYGENNTGLSHPRLEKIIKRYGIGPKVGGLDIDSNEYSWFKKHILGDE